MTRRDWNSIRRFSIESLSTCLALVWVAVVFMPAASADDSPSAAERAFRQQVAPVLARRCLGCHDQAHRDGGLSLATASEMRAGGESGSVFDADEPLNGRLWEVVQVVDGHAEMPAEGEPLTDSERQSLKEWLQAGAPWSESFGLDQAVGDVGDWWSWRPITLTASPHVQGDWTRGPLDAYVAATLQQRQAVPSAEAERRALVRRLYLDLIGLPPEPEEVREFVNDDDPRAVERLVDRLLASPRYGERWARHWLDVVHYGDSHGYDKDKPRLNAWHYRDYVVRAFNEDLPYATFVREQLAGDQWAEEDPEALIATGFLSAGPWDFISHVEVPESKIDGRIARNLDRDDMVRTTFEAFCSTTVGCARCHAHKFDPISQRDYYRMQAVFAAIDRADRRFDADPKIASRRTELIRQQQRLVQAEAELAAEISAKFGVATADLDQQIRERTDPAIRQRSEQFGYHSGIAADQQTMKWVQIDLGGSTELSSIELHGCHDDFGNIGSGFGFPVRFRLLVSDDPEFQDQVSVVFESGDQDYVNPGVLPVEFSAEGIRGRYVRVVADRLAPRSNDFIFALAELRVLNQAGELISLGAKVSALDTIDAPARWHRDNLVDGRYVGESWDETVRRELTDLQQQRIETQRSIDSSEFASRLQSLKEQQQALFGELAALPEQQTAFVGTTHFDRQGNFVPTEGTPRPIRVLLRGDVLSPGDPVEPGAISALPLSHDRFNGSEIKGEGEARSWLADWVVAEDQPLTWRSVANRIWHYHFGRGLVATPNDFGRMGAPPTHPELLDRLAAEMREHQSWKRLHRMICTSATYRQSSELTAEDREIDADGSWLSRMPRRRLEAEALRDSILKIAGVLDSRMYGPGYQDFVIDKPEHSPHYLYRDHDPSDPAAYRRTVYRFIVRSQPQPFLTTWDCADPSMSVEKRSETVTPQQALSLLNNPLVLEMAERFAERVRHEGESWPERLTLAFERVTGREPDDEELAVLLEHREKYGDVATCRLLLNLNELLFVD
jgi:mono/diheme cytochrome c family protein